MTRRPPLLSVLAAAVAWLAAPAAASSHDEGAKADAKSSKDEKKGDEIVPRVYEAERAVTADGAKIDYKVIAGETIIENAKGEQTAAIFATTYLKNGVEDARERPVAFIFNGGPGSASLWLHLGAFGPQRLKLPGADGPGPLDDGAAPYDLRENPHTILDVADLVFVDPVGTGFSRAVGEAKGEDFWGVTEDADSLREFIRRWLTEHKRWNSPKFLMGESYGTTRSAALINALEGGLTDIAINGVVLVSTVLAFGFDATDPGNDVGYLGLLPTYAATAWYHGKIDKAAHGNDLEAFLRAVRRFAIEEYMAALLKGQLLEEGPRDDIATKLAGFIGLDKGYLVRSNLRVPLRHFMRELRRDEGLSIGRLDSRFAGVEPDTIGENPEFDPSFYGIDAAYTAAMLDYFTRDIGVDFDDRYTTIGGVTAWNWKTADAGGELSYLNVAPYLAKAMRQNKDLRIMSANGYYDHATPFFGTELTFAQPGFDLDRITMTYYEAGHMMYIHEPSLEKLAEDVRKFVRGE
ncbi:MAG: S10 family peptidase [Parvularculaceae bacterium]